MPFFLTKNTWKILQHLDKPIHDPKKPRNNSKNQNQPKPKNNYVVRSASLFLSSLTERY